MRLVPQGFNEVVMNFLWGHAFLTEVLYDCSNFVHFLSLTYPIICSEFLLKSIVLKYILSTSDVDNPIINSELIGVSFSIYLF